MHKANFGPTDLLERMDDFSQNYKFSNKNDRGCTWRDFKKIFVGYADMINETLIQKFHPYSILS